MVSSAAILVYDVLEGQYAQLSTLGFPALLVLELQERHGLRLDNAKWSSAVSPPTLHKSKVEGSPESADSSGTDNVSAESTATRRPNGDVSLILMMQTLLNLKLRMKNQ